MYLVLDIMDFLSPLMIKKTGLFITLMEHPDKAAGVQEVPGYRNLRGIQMELQTLASQQAQVKSLLNPQVSNNENCIWNSNKFGSVIIIKYNLVSWTEQK